ncbi:hypothetical protein JZ751_028667 [Albula glossodonta]|uniref:Uncharacterized protein n=1 Tax=Albula glossodonta TaxID=121402 RepID=A0A8T2NCB8_9TELE|nr:hypothetical protein JZ751_028667 [Albula glossodonta]
MRGEELKRSCCDIPDHGWEAQESSSMSGRRSQVSLADDAGPGALRALLLQRRSLTESRPPDPTPDPHPAPILPPLPPHAG